MTTPQSCNGSSLGLLFRQVRDAMWAWMERELAAGGHDLTFSQYITLKTLSAGRAGVTELARAAQLHPGAMTRVLDRLEAQGLVARVTDPQDRRALHVDLTDAGRRLWDVVGDYGRRVHTQAMQGLDDAEQAQLLDLLARVRENLTPGSD
ncbi:MarR family winged helix-turn-helix transcriptional regulator [Cognatilysobacter lacus]|uniref:MarR family transcriptional regulator n=1 Tax=Cognatilysobacter lacus TaxID=1643323 RepID=A0A5D8Z7X3_9GAMM|nr:MarR family transcriptional regulator [Lysobacter lacus]TZF88754.1 MarR family transcriptional regulator [Lysobacter lacus]